MTQQKRDGLSGFSGLLARVAQKVDRAVGWDNVRTYVGQGFSLARRAR